MVVLGTSSQKITVVIGSWSKTGDVASLRLPFAFSGILSVIGIYRQLLDEAL
jgi:hypothetical protein